MSAEKEDQPSAATKYESIVLTLTQNDAASIDPLAFPIRSIRFTASEPRIQIGRSSKTVSKGLSPSEKNAYFDSPVMSRAHAEMNADLNEGMIYLKDLGSLHGTSVNKTALPKDSTVPLKAGDHVCFGIHVARGLEVFSPATVLVDVIPHAAKPMVARAYRAPEPTDELSDVGSECDCSGSDYHSNVDGSSGDKDDESDIAAMDNVFRTASDSGGETAHVVPLLSENANEINEKNIRGSSVAASLFDETLDQSHGDILSYGEGGSVSDNSDADAIELDYSEDELADPINNDEANDGDAFDDSDEEEEEEDLDDDDEDGDSHDASDVDDAMDMDDIDDSNDDGSDFLSTEISRFASLEGRPTVSTTTTHDITVSVVADSMPVDGLWTPPFAPSASPSDRDEPSNENVHDATEVRMEESEGADTNTDASALPRNDTLLNVTKKCNISSILNPSPPPSSPARDASVVATTVAIAPMDPAEVSFTEVYQNAFNHVICMGNGNNQERDAASTEVGKDGNSLATGLSQTSLCGTPKAPEPEDILSSAFLKPVATSALLESGNLFLFSSPQEPTGYNDDMDDDDSDAMVSAAVFNSYKKKKDANKKKRKADEMLAEDADASAATDIAPDGASSDSQRIEALGNTGPTASKRQATAAAMQSNRRLKGTMWAVAEKIGIAALGGAVVLGSLIYTAPAL